MLDLIQYSFSMSEQTRSYIIMLPLFKKISLGMALVLSFASAEVYAQAQSEQQQAAKEKVKESAWLSDPALTKFVQKMVESRYMPYKVLGQKDGKDVLTYKAYFRPFPADMERFYSYWGMTTA